MLASIQNRDLLKPESPVPIGELEKMVEVLRKTVAHVSAKPYHERLLHLLHYFEFLLAREAYLEGEKSAELVDHAIKQIHKERAYTYLTSTGVYSHSLLGKFAKVKHGGIDSWSDADVVYRDSHTFAVKVEEPDKGIRYHLWYAEVSNREPMQLIVELPQGKLKGKVIYQKEVPLDSSLEGTIPVPHAGTYLLRVKMKSGNQFTLQVKNPLFVLRADKREPFHPFASASTVNRRKEFHSLGTPGYISRYFYVPNVTSYFAVDVSGSGATEWVSFKIRTPDGKVFLSEEEWTGRKDFQITVPPAAMGKVWQLEYRNLEDAEFRLSDEVPGWLASHPNRLIVPEEFVKQ